MYRNWIRFCRNSIRFDLIRISKVGSIRNSKKSIRLRTLVPLNLFGVGSRQNMLAVSAPPKKKRWGVNNARLILCLLLEISTWGQYRHVYWNKGCNKWVVQQRNRQGKRQHVGVYVDQEEAAWAADAWLLQEYKGEEEELDHTRLNFPEQVSPKFQPTTGNISKSTRCPQTFDVLIWNWKVRLSDTQIDCTNANPNWLR